jgi:FtsH-binding integral membrane protein
MDNNFWNNGRSFNPAAGIDQADITSLTQFFTQVYTWMALGLAVTGFMAIVTVSNATLMNLIYGSRFTFFALVLLELGLVFAFTRALAAGSSLPALIGMFLTYSAVNGLTLSAILLVYTSQSVYQTFFVSAGMFAGMSLYGFVTKRDLTSVGQFAMMGLWGIFLAAIINIFLQSSLLSMVYSIIGVGVFVVLTAWDTQKLKALYHRFSGQEDGLKRLALHGALQLYLDFINLFIFLLRLFGNRK